MLQQLDQTLTLALNGSQSLYLDAIATSISATATWLPVAVLFFYVIVRCNNLRNILTILCALALCIFLADQVASSVCKPLVCRYRPSNDPALMYSVDVVNAYRGGRYGFFSSHAANTFAVATFVCLLIRHRALTLWLFSWALLNCWSRVYLGVHYVGDLLTGILWGSLVGYGIYRLLLALTPDLQGRRHYFASRQGFTVSGYSRASVYLFIIGIALTYLCISFSALLNA